MFVSHTIDNEILFIHLTYIRSLSELIEFLTLCFMYLRYIEDQTL